MLEASFRKMHRAFGIYLVGFLALQAVTGLFISLGTLASPSRDTWWFWLMAGLHHDWNPLGSAYRVLLAVFTLGQGGGRRDHLSDDKGQGREILRFSPREGQAVKPRRPKGAPCRPLCGLAVLTSLGFYPPNGGDF